MVNQYQEQSQIKVAFFCGHRSPYGLSHLMPIISRFDVKAVILGTDERWKIFRENLLGKTYYKPRDDYLILSAAKSIHARIVNLFKDEFREYKNIRRIMRSKNIDVWEIIDVNDEDTIRNLKALDIELFMSAAYPQIFSKELLNIPKLGAINFHPSLLPKYRGSHPHFWQIVNGEEEGGLTAHFMTENIDDGDIVAQLSFPIIDCTYSSVYEKMISHTPRLIEHVVKYFESAESQAKPQNAAEATYYRSDREIHRRIFWNIHSAQEIHNLIRAGNAFCFFRGKKVRFVSSYVTSTNRNLTNGVRIESGTIVDVGKDGLSVKTIDGCINIKEIRRGNGHYQFPQWIKKLNIYIGEKFD